MQSGQFVTVGMFPSRPEAHVSRARLESEGLEAIVSSDDANKLGIESGDMVRVWSDRVPVQTGGFIFPSVPPVPELPAE